jgi:phage terminase large subunit-like protein
MKADIPTLGPLVCKWIERYLVHSEGDYYGRPFRLIDHHRKFISKSYELNPDGSRRYRRALLGLAKGNGKSELAAALAIAELAGPVCFDGWKEPSAATAGLNYRKPKGKARTAPDIPVAAASFEQADLCFKAARSMITAGPLKNFFDVWDTEILPKDGPGRMYRVAAQAGTNDGLRPTFFIADELHEWVAQKERVHLVLSNGTMKRADTWQLAISTAGWDSTSLLGKLYSHGKRVEAGEESDPAFLFEWLEASKDYDLTDEQQLRAAIKSCNPGVGSFLNIESIVEKYETLPLHEFERYFLNRWTSAPERWLPSEAWNACSRLSYNITKSVPCVLGFDGSYSGDSTAIVGCTLEEKPHIFVVDCWEKDSPDWHVSPPDVMQTIRNFTATHNVKQIGCDPHRWAHELAILEEEGLPIVSWPSHTPALMSPACQAFERAVLSGSLSHDADPRLERHLNNCVVKIDSRGPRITKVSKDSPHKIDLAVAAVFAYDLSQRQQPKEKKYQAFTIGGDARPGHFGW